MGRPMALKLLQSGLAASVHVYSRNRHRLETIVSAGAIADDTPRALAASCDVILSLLPDLPELRGLLDGESGIIAGVVAPTLLVISSTSGVGEVRELAAEFDQRTNGLLRVIDAPVSGGPDGAASGTLAIMAGGAPEDFARAQPILATMGNPVLLGPLGSGEVAKACNQMIVASTMLALAEATVIAERCGLDIALLLDLLEGGYAGSRMLETRKRRLVEKDYSVAGAAKYMIKDLASAHAEAQRTATTTPQLATLQAVFHDVVERGFGDQDMSVVQAYVSSLSP
jgi:2-hydroxy-3-oxopropionate reductase